MPHWLIKSALHRAISWLPQSHRWNEWFQQYVSKSLDMSPEHFEVKLKKCRQHWEYLRDFGPAQKPDLQVVELGTGYYPIIPVGLSLCGAGRISTFDIAPLASSGRIQRMLDLYCDYAQSGRLQQILPWAVADRVANLGEVRQLARSLPPAAVLERFGIHSFVRDAQNTGLAAGSADFIFSTGVLDYLPYKLLESVFREFRRLCAPGALMSHHFGLQDQSADFDSSITRLNFLKYSSHTWNLLASPLIWQNRLRIPEYRKLHQETGFAILKETNTLGPAHDLEGVRLDKEFQEYSMQELLVATTWLLARPV